MNDDAKLSKIKNQLNIAAADTSLDVKLTDYLDSAKEEILNWMYINRGRRPIDLKVPAKYEIVQINAVVVAITIEGSEGESSHSEDGVSMTFNYDTMIAFIHKYVYQIV